MLSLAAVGDKFINSSHVIIKRKVLNSGGDIAVKEKIVGIYAAPGVSNFNSTHIVKKASNNKTTAVLSVAIPDGESNNKPSYAKRHGTDNGNQQVYFGVQCSLLCLICSKL